MQFCLLSASKKQKITQLDKTKENQPNQTRSRQDKRRHDKTRDVDKEVKCNPDKTTKADDPKSRYFMAFFFFFSCELFCCLIMGLCIAVTSSQVIDSVCLCLLLVLTCLFVYLCFNPRTGDMLLSNQSHLRGLVYVFSVANDNAFVSYLVYSQLVTMKAIQGLIDSGDTYNSYERERGIFFITAVGIARSGNAKVRINWYRGHTSSMVSLYCNECCELENGEVYVWCVSTAQLERQFLRSESIFFMHDICNPESSSDTGIVNHYAKTMKESMKYYNNKYDNHYNDHTQQQLQQQQQLNEKNLTHFQKSIIRTINNYGNDIQRDNQLNCNCFIDSITFHHYQASDVFPRSPNNVTHLMIPNSQTQRNVDNSEIRKLFDLLCRLFGWRSPSYHEVVIHLLHKQVKQKVQVKVVVIIMEATK